MSPFENASTQTIPHRGLVYAIPTHNPSLNTRAGGRAVYRPTGNEKYTRPTDTVLRPRSDPSPNERVQDNAPSYSDPLSSVYPVPPPAHRSSVGRRTGLVPTSSITAYPTERDSYEDDGDDGGQAVREGHAFESRHRVDTRGRVDGGSGRRRSRENLIRTAYFTHTDAGEVRLVELPPSYTGLQFQSSTQQE